MSLDAKIGISIVEPFYASLPIIAVPAFFFLCNEVRGVNSIPTASTTQSVFSFSVAEKVVLIPTDLSPFFAKGSP